MAESPRWKVSYRGFLQPIERFFNSREEAETWARQAGIFWSAKITKSVTQKEGSS